MGEGTAGSDSLTLEALDAAIYAVEPAKVLHTTPRLARQAARCGWAQYADWREDPQFRGLFRRDRARLVEERRERRLARAIKTD